MGTTSAACSSTESHGSQNRRDLRFKRLVTGQLEIRREAKKIGFGPHLNIKREFDTHINLSGHLDNLGELNRFLGCILQIFDGKDLQSGLVDLECQNNLSVFLA